MNDIRLMNICSLEGNIGAGKSTLIKSLRDDNKEDTYISLEEVTGYHTLVKNFYENPKQHAFPFQVAMLVRKARATLAAQRSEKYIKIIERCIDSNFRIFCKMTFLKGNMDEIMYQNYKGLYEDLKAIVPEPGAVLYLDIDPDLAYHRIGQRNRGGESNITLSYLEDLNRLYVEWIEEREKEGLQHIKRVKIEDKTTVEDIKEQYNGLLGHTFYRRRLYLEPIVSWNEDRYTTNTTALKEKCDENQ